MRTAYRFGSAMGRIHVAAITGAADFNELLGKVLGVITIIAFIYGVILLIGAGMRFKDGDSAAGKQSIIGGAVIAGSVALMGYLFKAAGLDDAAIDAEFD
jgi:hypothetical protein